MYEWLERELSEINTPKFHIVSGPITSEMRNAVIASSLPLPESYREFVVRFGNAKLYRSGRNDSYLVGIFAGPREVTLQDGTHIYQVGFHDGASVYVKPSDSGDLPIFEFEGGVEEKVGEDFAAWLVSACDKARNSYGKEKWLEILRGPEPFTSHEENIIQARKQIHWRTLGIDAQGFHKFEITNSSSRTLPFLTIGVRSKDGRLNGATILKIGHIKPGQTEIVRGNCYKQFLQPNEIDIFDLPDPQPEDRERYAELGESMKTSIDGM